VVSASRGQREHDPPLRKRPMRLLHVSSLLTVALLSPHLPVALSFMTAISLLNLHLS
jgi:hypothetical protein